MSRKLSLIIAVGVIAVTLCLLGLVRLWPDRYQNTNDAYVVADYTLIAPKVSGFIAKVLVEDNQPVNAGQLLALIDDRDYRARLDSAQADLIAAQASLEHLGALLDQQQAVIDQSEAKVKADTAQVTFAQQDLSRYQRLSDRGLISLQTTQQARSRIDTALAQREQNHAGVAASVKQVAVLQAQLKQAQAVVKRHEAELEQARLNLSYTRITAPADGLVGKRDVRVGALVSPGTPLMAVVPLEQAYIVGNFQETQLTRMQPGQPVQVQVDSLPGETLRGRIESIAPGTGLSFSPLAPINATGNFTKIVQRIPVKIVLEPDQPQVLRLRMGMSVNLSIDTRT
ncbi:HlyD family secretion protein [Pseudomonas akapageensis]|uniref:HlyD family secretion protein n=1 Tax=Pseudomonas akapageensis TaxID=2609961 RepID=UPI00140E3C38|nr:HlyD family secretion protein [Pseudomonas akapageensis]